ncbi:triphosphoribosyl-dephospho-CoA synthase CitG [Photobacterium toruni]|uniref:Probable 2-(5''-triphosphoribosyl)-3'-dephosphocoenzyme-A synthase n=1 Tax=Photobacterium toruni TaxID=1935446 RepID=A0ABU6LCA0_9GAMM|nr:triphosphoribosyl-dephospho-CoA synthase CitG [Photobacterium toruni]
MRYSLAVPCKQGYWSKINNQMLSEPERIIGQLSFHSMLSEVELYPKPGLVTAISNGAHQDMSISTFKDSANALLPYMTAFARAGYTFNQQEDLSQLLVNIRPIGIQAERVMFQATNQINTHRGAIFMLGILSSASGYLLQTKQPITALLIQPIIKAMCVGVSSELSQGVETSNGREAFIQYGISGIRGEAELGFPTVIKGLMTYQSLINAGYKSSFAMHHALLTCMAFNDDSCLIKRGGLNGLTFVQKKAARLQSSELSPAELITQLIIFDQECVSRNLSPGGSADCLSAILLLSQLEQLTTIQ